MMRVPTRGIGPRESPRCAIASVAAPTKLANVAKHDQPPSMVRASLAGGVSGDGGYVVVGSGTLGRDLVGNAALRASTAPGSIADRSLSECVH